MVTIRRVKITEVREGKIKRFDADGIAEGEFKDREFFQQFGLTSKPRKGCEGVVIGSGNVFFLMASEDRDNRPATADDGDVVLFTDKDNYILIKESGEMTIKSTTKVTVDSPAVELGDGALKKLIDERIVDAINNHTHSNGNNGAPTGTPITPIVLANVATAKTTAS